MPPADDASGLQGCTDTSQEAGPHTQLLLEPLLEPEQTGQQPLQQQHRQQLGVPSLPQDLPLLQRQVEQDQQKQDSRDGQEQQLQLQMLEGLEEPHTRDQEQGAAPLLDCEPSTKQQQRDQLSRQPPTVQQKQQETQQRQQEKSHQQEGQRQQQSDWTRRSRPLVGMAQAQAGPLLTAEPPGMIAPQPQAEASDALGVTTAPVQVKSTLGVLTGSLCWTAVGAALKAANCVSVEA
jgi:hypothetical protein